MRRLLAVIVLTFISVPAEAAPTDGAPQLVVVRAASWNARGATLRRYTRREGRWALEGAPIPVALGGKGLAWGRGVAPVGPDDVPGGGPLKKEGDNRTPAGIFHLGAATGTAAAPPTGTRLPYTRATDDLYCVDDGASPAYNQVTASDAPAWSSAEVMNNPPVYDWTIFVAHNPERAAGGGSCIFLHVWRRAGATTAGCTAMAKPELETLMAWLDPAALVVVLPEAAYKTQRKAWGLP